MSTLDAPPRHYATRGGTALAPAPVRRPGPPRPGTARPAEDPARRHLRVVAPADRVRRRLTPATGVLLTALLFVTLFLIAIAHTLLVQGQLRLDGLDDDLRVEQARYQELRKEVAEMESPARVVAAAEHLGMVTPQDLVYLQPDAPQATRPPEVTSSSSSSDAGLASGGPNATWGAVKPLLEAIAP